MYIVYYAVNLSNYGTVSGIRQRPYAPFSLACQNGAPKLFHPAFSPSDLFSYPLPRSYLTFLLASWWLLYIPPTIVLYSLFPSHYLINISSQWPPHCDWEALLSVLPWSPSLLCRLLP